MTVLVTSAQVPQKVSQVNELSINRDASELVSKLVASRGSAAAGAPAPAPTTPSAGQAGGAPAGSELPDKAFSTMLSPAFRSLFHE